ncbi:hypothetical protein DVR12_26850 [Chitinophaga silvatica]|uniref:Uncharacterized protein n=1 Tax=Chitinophaga silvatica TaxID=2282649 RepID=A0A3E1Y2A0_9BACT|nr:hypothetical protein [Chitinophaga silvatica]RFS18820.1 hypothetical protein DVR12_26850 [Chitinophaga silvatica]
MKRFIKEVKERIASPTPGFFRKIKIAGKILMGGSGALLAPTTAGIDIPDLILEIAKGLFIAGSVMAAVAAAAVEGE